MATAIGKSKSISGFDPRSIPGCVLWLDGSDSSTITLSSTSVSQWSDKSGYGLNAVASGISSATLPIQGTMNGLNTVRFSASGYTALKTPLILPLTNSFGGGASYFVVGQATSSSASGGGRILVSDSQVRQFSVSTTPPAYLQAYSGANPVSLTASIQASVPFVASIIEGNGTMTSYVNGIANATTSATTALTSASFYIGSATTVGNNFDGDIGEILIFQNTLTSVQQQQIEAYLFWKWGVTTTAYPLALTPYVWYDASISGNFTTSTGSGAGLDLVTAGGGGGSGYSGNGGNGGLTGGTGATGNSVPTTANGGGGGSSSGGTAGVDPTTAYNGYVGTLGTGGAGGTSSSGSISGGGGGGGYWGGGGGSARGSYGGNGGGGSSLTTSSGFSLTSCTSGGGGAGGTYYQYGTNGSVSISYSGGSASYSSPGVSASFTVPSGITSLNVTLNGAGGGGGGYGYGGAGAQVIGTLAVSPGQVYNIIVGGGGSANNPNSGTTAASGGGAPAGVGIYAGGGGGRSAIVSTVSYTVYNWTDKTGNSRNATQTTLGSVPTWTSSVQNGLGGILFSGAQCYNLPTLTSFNPISIFVVAKATSFSSGATILSLTASTGIYFRSTNGASNPTYTSYGVDYGGSSYRYVPNSAVTDTNTHLWGFVLPASGLGTFTFDGVVGNAASGFTTSQIGTTYSTGSIGAYGQTASSSPFTGYIFEVIIFNYALSTAQRQSIEGYLNKKWAIYTTKNSIISTNPYYSIKPYSQSFSPLYIDGLQLWMDAADSTTITGSSPVTQWNDKSGNGYNFTASAGPVLATASQNGLNTLTFTAASSQFLSNTATVNFMELYSLSIFAVFKYSDTTSGGYIFAKSLYGGANGRILLGRDAGTPATLNAGIATTANAFSTYSDVYTANTWRVYGFVADRSAGTVKAYQNGSNNASASFTVDTTTNLTTAYPMAIGAYNNSSGTLAPPQAGLYFNGSIGEILVYSTALTNQQRQQVEGYLSRKWNIPLSNTIISAVASGGSTNVSFSYISDAIQTWVVPAGVTSLTSVTVNGAGGYSGYQQTSAGRGASVVGTLTVTPGATLSIYVGRCGTVTSGYNQTSTGGWPGGGSANTGEEGGGGGGYSAIANNPVTTYYVIAGAGGGGTGYGGTGGDGGANGSSGTSVNGNNPATGGTQSAGGSGTGGGSSGGYLTGGNATSTTYNGGGGGAGYYGGGGGPGGGAGGLLGGGGGGSSLTTGSGFTLTSVTTGGGGARNANGSVSFSYTGTTNTYGPHPFGIIPPTLDVQFSPLNLSGLTTLWLDAADSSTIQFGTGSAVYQWSDKSGNNNHVWQPTAINQPTYGLDTTYQKYGIQFTNGGNTVLIPQILSSYPVNSKNYSIFIAFRSTNPVTSTQNIMYTNTGSYTESIYLNYFYTYIFGFNNCYSSINTNINETTTTSTYYFIVTIGILYLPLAAIYSSIAGSSLFSFVNGTLNASSVRTAPVNHYANYNIGAQSASAGEMSGTIFEIIILNCAASTALQQKIEGYLANKWGLALSSSHPFYKIQTAPSSTYTIPSAVTGITLSGISSSGGTISWTAGSIPGIGYQWYVGTALGSGVIASGVVAASVLTTTFSASLTLNTTYYYWIIAFNSMVNSPVTSLTSTYSTALYTFSGTLTFTPALATGTLGPILSACTSAYSSFGSWVTNTSYFNVITQGYQLWTVPSSRNYTVVCAGASGGSGSGPGGTGVSQTVTLSLTMNHIIVIVVGQVGQSASNQGGGGGGTFIYNQTTSTLLICSGGGGGGYYGNYSGNSSQANATIANTGKGGVTGLNSTIIANGGTGGGGGNNAYSVYSPGTGAGGGGYTGNGVSGGYGTGGLSYTNGATGGSGAASYAGTGGFGGGGSGDWNYWTGGGGGGGYSGGGGGVYYGVGGGGGSYSSVSLTSSTTNSGNGFVSIT